MATKTEGSFSDRARRFCVTGTHFKARRLENFPKKKNNTNLTPTSRARFPAFQEWENSEKGRKVFLYREGKAHRKLNDGEISNKPDPPPKPSDRSVNTRPPTVRQLSHSVEGVRGRRYFAVGEQFQAALADNTTTSRVNTSSCKDLCLYTSATFPLSFLLSSFPLSNVIQCGKPFEWPLSLATLSSSLLFDERIFT